MRQITFGASRRDVAKSVNMLLHPLKVFFVFMVFVFSFDVLACEDVTGTVDAPSRPNNPVSNYAAGYIIFCAGEKEKGLGYIERASEMGHVTASYFLGEYYRKDKDLNSSTHLPKTQENYDAAIFYYERAAKNIENLSSYPRRPDGRVHEAEAKNYMSIRTFLNLISLYFDGYSLALGDILENDVSYTDTIQVLENMKNAAERCLRRPSLPIWGARQGEIAHSKQVRCKARKDFSYVALDLEFQRIEIAKRCDVALSECTEHQDIFQELVRATNKMNKKVNSVPKI